MDDPRAQIWNQPLPYSTTLESFDGTIFSHQLNNFFWQHDKGIVHQQIQY